MSTLRKVGSKPNLVEAVFCVKCLAEGSNVKAVKQCTECADVLCNMCSNEHEKEHEMAKDNANILTDIKVKKIINQRVDSKTPLMCFEHDESIERFCTNHDQLICSVCVLTAHFDCSTLSIPEAAKGIRGSRETTQAVDSMQKLKTKFENIITEKRACLQSIQDQDKLFNLEIKTFKAYLVSLLNKLEKEVVSKKDAFIQSKKAEITGQIETCKTAMSDLTRECKELDRVFLGSSDNDIFMNTKRSRLTVRKQQKVCSTMDKTTKRVVFSFQPNGTIEKFFVNCRDIGTMKMDTASSDSFSTLNKSGSNSNIASKDVPAGRKESSWAPRNRTMILYDEVKQVPGRKLASRQTRKPLPSGEVNIYFEDDDEVAFVTGVDFMPDEQLIIADESNKCTKLFNVKLQPVDKLKLTSSPRDLTPVANSLVAVTLPHEKTIQFLYVTKTMEQKKRLQLDIECYGITFHANELYVTSGFSANREIQVLSLDGSLRKRLKPGIVDLRYPLYIVVEPRTNIMFVSDYNHGIVGIDMRGAVKFKCQETDIHNYYKGLALSVHGYLYVCTWSMNGISQVHTDGRGLETIIPMPEKGGLKPYAIGYSKRSKTVVISLCGKNRGFMSVYKFIN